MSKINLIKQEIKWKYLDMLSHYGNLGEIIVFTFDPSSISTIIYGDKEHKCNTSFYGIVKIKSKYHYVDGCVYYYKDNGNLLGISNEEYNNKSFETFGCVLDFFLNNISYSLLYDKEYTFINTIYKYTIISVLYDKSDIYEELPFGELDDKIKTDRCQICNCREITSRKNYKGVTVLYCRNCDPYNKNYIIPIYTRKILTYADIDNLGTSLLTYAD